MSTRESELRDRLNRLQQMDMALMNRIMVERDRLWRKQMELMSLRQQLAAMAPVMPFAALGALALGGRSEARRVLLLDRIQNLEREIMRERELLRQLEEQRSRLAEAIHMLTEELTRVRVLTEEQWRREYIQWLYQELRAAIAAKDEARVRWIMQQLRALGAL